MSALRTLRRSCPFFTVSPSRALTSTTRPEASEMAGTERATSGLTTPVTVSSGAALCSPAATRGNCSGWATLNVPESSSCSTCSLRRRPEVRLHLPAAAGEKGDQGADRAMRTRSDVSFDNLPAYGEIQLGRGGQIRTDQVQIGELDAPVVALGIEKIEQRCAAALVGKGHGVADRRRLLQVLRLVGLEEDDGAA